MATSKIAQYWHTYQAEPIDLSFREAFTVTDLLDDLEQSPGSHTITATASSPPIHTNLKAASNTTRNTQLSTFDTNLSLSNSDSGSAPGQRHVTSEPSPSPPFSNTRFNVNAGLPATASSKNVVTIKETHSALKLSNNHLSQLTSFSSLLQKLHLIIDQLKWLDLSFNQFTSIDPSLQACTGLTHLYLHANQIEKITVIEKLSTFSFSKQLKSFAIHGNPVSQHKDCKRCVLLACPKLKHFDFCGVTKGDRSTAKYTGTKDHVVLAKS